MICGSEVPWRCVGGELACLLDRNGHRSRMLPENQRNLRYLAVINCNF